MNSAGVVCDNDCWIDDEGRHHSTIHASYQVRHVMDMENFNILPPGRITPFWIATAIKTR